MHAVREAVARALAEDLDPLGDLTSSLLPATEARARFVARTGGRLAGLRCAEETFAQVDASVEVAWSADDGAVLAPGDVFGVVSGRLSSILTAERTALNFLGHLSGIATLTAAFVAAAAGQGGDGPGLGHPQDRAGHAGRWPRPRCGPAGAATTAATCRTGC